MHVIKEIALGRRIVTFETKNHDEVIRVQLDHIVSWEFHPAVEGAQPGTRGSSAWMRIHTVVPNASLGLRWDPRARDGDEKLSEFDEDLADKLDEAG